MGKNVVKIGDKFVGDGHPTYVVAEIGINHNGDVDIAKKLIGVAKWGGANAVKFQKRTVDIVYTKEDLAKPRESVFGNTNGDLKRGLEFGIDDYREIDKYCKDIGIPWFASCWDELSVDFINKFDPPCYKIASACLTDDSLLKYTVSMDKPIILSTGGSSTMQISHALDIITKVDEGYAWDNVIILHCNASYPCRVEELNLRCIEKFRNHYSCPIGYSGHEVGIPTTECTIALGANMIERHITMDRSTWGSDQSASVEPIGFEGMVRHIRGIEKSLGDGIKKVYDTEIQVMKKLRRVG